jgi:hypothetical protein
MLALFALNYGVVTTEIILLPHVEAYLSARRGQVRLGSACTIVDVKACIWLLQHLLWRKMG